MKFNAVVLWLAAALLALTGCVEVEYNDIYQDLPVEFDVDDDQDVVSGVKSIKLGLFEEQLFREIGDGDAVPIIHGFQGGTWVHLSIRVTGLRSDGIVEASLGEVGFIQYGLRLTRSPEGFLEAYDIPIPVPLDEQGLQELYGQSLELRVAFSSEGVAVEQVLLVTVVEG